MAVVAHNPVNRSIFGPQGLSKIDIPVLMGAGSYDPATPFVFEQLNSFTWLDTPSKYLMLLEAQAHVDVFAIDGGMSEVIESVEELTLPEPQLYKNKDMLLQSLLQKCILPIMKIFFLLYNLPIWTTSVKDRILKPI